jgi:hypothetical protein
MNKTYYSVPWRTLLCVFAAFVVVVVVLLSTQSELYERIESFT